MNFEWSLGHAGESWDRLVMANPASGFMQSSAWADLKRLEGYGQQYLSLTRDGSVIGGASLLEYPGSGIVVCPEGPVIPWEEPSVARMALRGLTDFCRAEGVMILRIEPHLALPRPGYLRNWRPAPVSLTPEHTLFVSLDGEPDDWLARMHPKWRYNVRLAERHGVEVVEHQSVAGVKEFYRLFSETAQRDGFFAEPIGFFMNLASTLFPCNMATILLARHEKVTLGAILLLCYGPRATYLYGASSSLYRQLMPNYANHFAAMQLAARRGCREYDLYGYDPFGRPDHLYAGISRFKSGWGGIRKDWAGAYDYLYYDQVAERMTARLSDYGL